MSLADVQQAIARIVCDRRALAAFTADPARWAQQRGLARSDARVLTGVPPRSLSNFHAIQARDRASFVEAILPLTIARAGDGWSSAYFDRYPFAEEDLLGEARRFMSFLADISTEAGTLALARLELARFELLREPEFASSGAPTTTVPKAGLARGLRVVDSAVDLSALENDPHVNVTSERGVALLRRDEDGVSTAWLQGALADALSAYASGDAPRIQAVLATEQGQDAALALAAEGALR